MDLVPTGPGQQRATSHPDPWLNAKVAKQALGSWVHTGTCPLQGSRRLQTLFTFRAGCQPPLGPSSALMKGAYTGQMAHQRADDRHMPTSGKGH